MAMSLEDLLAEEGFKRSKAKMMARTSFASEGRNMSLYPQRDKPESSSLLALKRTDRTRSDITRYKMKEGFSAGSSKLRDTVIHREKTTLEYEKSTSLKHERRSRRDSWDAKRFSIGSSDDLQSPKITKVGINSPYKDVYLNKVYVHEENKGKNVLIDKKNSNNSFKNSRPPSEQRSFHVNSRISMKEPESSYKKSNGITQNNKISETSERIRETKIEEVFAIPALDEAAIKAIISILSGHAKRFLKDEEFRTFLRHNSFASLNFDEGLNSGSKVIENLEQAIEIAERAVEENATLKELKRASLQLSVITGLNSKDLKDRFTSGIPNFKLSACAHLYLSVIYILQKKDAIAAKYLLQVFCHSPFQARCILLPDLWNHLFLPHLVHLKLWYEKEAFSLSGSPFVENRNLLDEVYNEILDLGTYKFALYYKDWLDKAVEAPSLPLIKIPSFSVQLMPKGGLHGHTCSPVNNFSPQAMVSKKLYDEGFRHSHNGRAHLQVGLENKFVSARSFISPTPEDKQLILYSHESLICTNQNPEPDADSLPDDALVAMEAQRLHSETSSRELNIDEIYGEDCHWQQENSHTSNSFQARLPENKNNLLPERPETPVFELQEIEEPRFLPQLENSEYPVISQIELESHVQELRENHKHFCGKPSLFNIPKDFVCPLTGLPFEDPVTLETGQTFEREAITNWFDKGITTCPVTIKTLQCQSVPDTNLILKRVIDYWNTEHYRNLLDLVSRESENNTIISTLEQLLVVLSKEERTINARRVIYLGGLQFLLRRFHCGNSKETGYILPLLSCCIEADESCKNDVVRNINKLNLLELLHSEQVKSRTNAVLLLTDLICLNRRNNAKRFLEGLQNEEITNAMDDLLVYLETCPVEERPLVAVLLLNLDLLSESHIGDIYRHEAVDALTITLEGSFSDEKVQKKCSRALLVLGGCFSSSGKVMTEDWILKLSGFLNGPDWDNVDNEANDIAVDSSVKRVGYRDEDSDDEEKAKEKWLMSLSVSLIGDGKKSFLDAISKCLCLGNSDLVRVCLTTVAWLSSSLTNKEFQLYAFSALISPLKNCLDHGKLVEHRILASLSLLNFSRIPECSVLLMNIAEEISISLENLAEVTWTAKELHAVISGRRR